MTEDVTELPDSALALSSALAEAKHYGSSWAKVGALALQRAVDEFARMRQTLAAVVSVRVIDGEFVDADELYRALGLPKPRRTAHIDVTDEAGRWREHVLELADEARKLRRRVRELEDDQRALTEVSNAQAAEIRQQRADAEMRHFRYVISSRALPREITLICAQCNEGNRENSLPFEDAIVARIPWYVTNNAWPWQLEQLDAAAREHENDKHRRPGKRRRRPHNRAGRRANQERSEP